MHKGERGGRQNRRRWLLTLVGVVVALVLLRAFTIDQRPVREFTRIRPRPLVMAHQGASGHAPSNTMESFKLAMEQGADVLELDAHLTKDGVLVVSHDETIDRLSNGSGFIKQMTLAELRRFDFGHDFTPDGGKTFPYRGKGVTIPTLEEVFKAFPGVPVNIEIKQADPPMEKPLWELIQRYKMEDKVLIVSFLEEPMRRWKALAGERVATAPPVNHMYGFVALYLPYLDWLYAPSYDAFQVPTAQSSGPVTVHFDTERFINRAHKLNMAVHYWTINDEAEIRRLYELGADGIMTDFPDRAVKVLKELGKR